MDISEFIGKIQKKPYRVRVVIMWTGLAVCMAVVFGVWLWNFKSVLADVSQKNESVAGSDLTSAFQQFKKDMPTLWGSLGEGLDSAIDSFKSEEVSPSPASGEPLPQLPLE